MTFSVTFSCALPCCAGILQRNFLRNCKEGTLKFVLLMAQINLNELFIVCDMSYLYNVAACLRQSAAALARLALQTRNSHHASFSQRDSIENHRIHVLPIHPACFSPTLFHLGAPWLCCLDSVCTFQAPDVCVPLIL